MDRNIDLFTSQNNELNVKCKISYVSKYMEMKSFTAKNHTNPSTY